jgi:DNA repair exonuclease SbcCD ATPase subunit
MKKSGLSLAYLVALLVSSQFAGPNLAFSEPEQPEKEKKPLLKIEKDSAKAGSPKPAVKDAAGKPLLAKPAVKDTASKPAFANSASKESVAKPVSKPAENSASQPALSKPAANNASGKPEESNAAQKTSGALRRQKEKEGANNNDSGVPMSKKKQVPHPSQVHASGGDGLIPPPPAFQPSYLLNPSGGLGMPIQIEYMTKEMMLQRLKDVQQQYSDAKTQLEDKTAQMKEKKEKAERFASLYEEGVVSRHELEAASKEAEEAQTEIKRFQANLADLESQKTALNGRLKPDGGKVSQTSKSKGSHKKQSVSPKP